MATHPDTGGQWVNDPTGIFQWKSNGEPGGTEARPVRPLAGEGENVAYAMALSLFDGESASQAESYWQMFKAPSETVQMLGPEGVAVTVPLESLPIGQQEFYLSLGAQAARDAMDARSLIAGGELYRQGLGPAPLTPAVNYETLAPPAPLWDPRAEWHESNKPNIHIAAAPDTLAPVTLAGTAALAGGPLAPAAGDPDARKKWLWVAGVALALVVGWYLTVGRK